MLFKAQLARKIFTGQKTQTRRIKKDGEYATGYIHRDDFGGKELDAPYVSIYGNRLKWMDGGVYGVQVKRGGHSIGKIRVLNLWDEDIQDIDTDSAIAEGFTGKDEFFEAWVKINGKKSLNADVWVIEFEPLAKVGDMVTIGQEWQHPNGKLFTPDWEFRLVWSDNELQLDPCTPYADSFFVHPDFYKVIER